MVMGAEGAPDRVVVNLPPTIVPESRIVSPGCALARADVNWLAVETGISWGLRAGRAPTQVLMFRVLVAGLFKVTGAFCTTALLWSAPVPDTVDVAAVVARAMSDVRANSIDKTVVRKCIHASLDLGYEVLGIGVVKVSVGRLLHQRL